MRLLTLFAKIIIFCLFFLNTTIQAQNKTIELTEAEQIWLSKKHTVRIRVGSWPPFMITDGNIRGISIDYIKNIFARHNINYKFISGKEVSWKKALENIKKHKKIDMVPTAKITEERKKDMVFTDEYLFLPWVIFSRNNSPFISGMKNLAGKTISVPDGYVMHNLLKKNYPAIKLKVIHGGHEVERSLELLAKGAVDAYAGNLAVGSYIIQKNGYTNIKVAAPTPFGTHNQAMAIRDDWPELATIINKNLKQFTQVEHSQFLNRWLSVRYEHGIRKEDVVKWIMSVVGFLAIIISIIIFWNRKLNEEIDNRLKAEEQLRESEYKYRTLSDASFESIILSRKGIILDANSAMTKMFGYNTNELIGMESIVLIEPAMRKEVEDKISTDYEKPYETTAIKKDGSTFPMEIQAKIYTYKGKKVRVTAGRNLTVQKKIEEEIKNLIGILPLCSYCKKVRNDSGYWEQVDVYIHKYSQADVSHSICPDCMKKEYPEVIISDD
jgi:PAS domain S-box-containing protein